MTPATVSQSGTRLRVLLAFAAVYLIWGSTYLGIRVAIETLPPLMMAGARYLAAGGVLYALARWRGAPAPRREHWRWATVVGAFMLLGGNGAVVWAEQRVPSGLAALLIATVPLWMALLAWRSGAAPRPSGLILLGLLLGMLGVALLVSARGLGDGRGVDPIGAVVLIGGALSWAHGSLVARRGPAPSNPFLATAMQMLAGGVCLTVAGLARGEWGRFDPAAVSSRSVFAFLYLWSFGSFLGFTAYIYLLRATTPARAATYAFVNPLVAVVLGWTLAGETLSARTLVAAAIIVSGVVAIVTGARPAAKPAVAAITPGPRPVPGHVAPAEARGLDEPASARLS